MIRLLSIALVLVLLLVIGFLRRDSIVEFFHWHFSSAACSTFLLLGSVATIVVVAGVLVATGK